MPTKTYALGKSNQVHEHFDQPIRPMTGQALPTVREILESQSPLTPDIIAVQINGRVVDLHTQVEASVDELKPIRLNDPKALDVIRHSSAHVMADAIQRLFPGTKVAFGPATDNGFYYDVDRPEGSFSEEDLTRIEQKMEEIIAQDFSFERREVSTAEAKKLLQEKDEKYKLEHLDRLQGSIFIYQHGGWVDLCEGPHVPSTRYLKAFKLTTVAGAYWRGDERNPMLQRVYGTAFPNEKALKKYLKQLEEAKKRDHRKLGKELDLIAFHPWAPASPFFLPRGAQVYQSLNQYIRGFYDRDAYQEIITPQVFDKALFETSGHLPTYAENIYMTITEDNISNVAKVIHEEQPDSPEAVKGKIHEGIRFGVKPMNCPSHCLMFAMKRRSYRELPMRLADFGRLHRYERSGVVQGLTRVRTFSQDDAHIFCMLEQVQNEILRFLDLVYEVYQDFGFEEIRIVLATRPNEKLGSDEIWDQSEKALEDAIKEKGLPYEIAEGEGAFYGPKIEFHLKDALGRPWQLGTIQADFNLPERFDLQFTGEDNQPHRPVMLHRAILGSVERFMGVLIEHCNGAFPTWLAPEQIALVTVSEKFNDFALELEAKIRDLGFKVVTNTSSDKLGAKIREARMLRIPFIGVIGQKEVEGNGVALRSRDENKDLGFVAYDALIEKLRMESLPPSKNKPPMNQQVQPS